MFSVHIIIIYRCVLEKYYTDHHDVDEDVRTLLEQGDRWVNGGMTGITRRDLSAPIDYTVDAVASKKIIYNLLVY